MKCHPINLLLGLATAVAAQSASASNYAQSNVSIGNVELAVTDSLDDVAEFNLIPLTPGAYSILPNGSNSNTGLNGYLTSVFSTTANISSQWTAFTSCDSNAYSNGLIDLQSVITAEINAKVSAIIFYSLQDNFCNISGDFRGFQNIYSLTEASDAMFLADHLGGSQGYTSTIFSSTAFNNKYNPPGAPGTAVAMIILYAITGLVTLTFLAIIVTGAVRAHRHPERYGTRDILGRPQNRAKGIARAILDTIPIVKFGERSGAAPAKEGDIELAGPNANSESIQPQAESSVADTHDQKKQPTTVVTDSQSPADAQTPVNPPVEAQNTNADPSLACSICTEDFERGEDIRVLPCQHKFHPACVDPWLLDVSGTCPLCRIDLRPTSDNAAAAASGSGADAATAGGADAMPPPLDGPGNRGSAAMKRLFAGVRNFSVEERIDALRRLRAENETPQSVTHSQTHGLGQPRSGASGNSSGGVVSSIGLPPTAQAQNTQVQGQADDARRAGRLRALLGRASTHR